MELWKVESPKWRLEFTAENRSQQLLHLDIDTIELQAIIKKRKSQVTVRQPAWATVRFEAVRSTSSKTTTV